MICHILLLGDVPEADFELLRSTAEGLNATVGRHGTGDLPNLPDELPAGYISFLPCDQQTMLGLFASIPVGSGEDAPLFQRLEADSLPPFLAQLPVSGLFRAPLSVLDARNIILSVLRQATLLDQNRKIMGEVARYRKEKNRLVTLGTSLSAQYDMDSLLGMILAGSREIVAADAGSIYVREQNKPGGAFTNRILFKIAQNDSIEITEKARELPITIGDSSISGYVALTGKALIIDDVYTLAPSAPYRWSRDYDKRFGYRTKSMLTVPLKNLAGEVVGVLQLMNKKKSLKAMLVSAKAAEIHTIPFTRSDEDFVTSVASLAAVTIERVQLYENIQDIFQGFLSSSAAAIDERDRVTSGHSRRVAGYAMAFVDALDEVTEGVFADVKFSRERKRQFEFAALLHDIGKIGVPEAILTKESRLMPGEMESIASRFEYIRLSVSTGASLPWPTPLDVDDDLAFIDKSNRAGTLSDADRERLRSIRAKHYVTTAGARVPCLTDGEWERLDVPRGNLTASERDLINSHAQSTRRILSKIPWTKDLKEIPTIACHHHEKLDGSGYPDGLKAPEICFECKILAVVDIYEALVSQDRPYKPKMPPQKAIEILRAEAGQGRLDKDVVEFFVEKGIFRLYYLGEAA